MSDEAPTIQQQIDEVSLVVVNRKAWLDRRAELQRQGRQLPPDITCTASTIAPLEAAVRSLEWLRENRAWILSAADQGKRLKDTEAFSWR